MNAEMPKSAGRLIAEAFTLYRRYPLLFLVLAAGVIVPYELILLAATGDGPFEEPTSAASSWLISLADLVLVAPLVSALHVHAVADARAGIDPRLGAVARRGLVALPVVAAASVMSGLGIAVGFALLVLPGLYLTLRWFVVAQAAAIEREGWLPALGRSHQLVSGHYGHVIVFALVVGAVSFGPILLLGTVLGSTDPLSFTVAVIVQVLCVSFAALTTALLYFDLRKRRELAMAPGPRVGEVGAAAEFSGAETGPSDHDVDPRLYTDETRPSGWYIDPENPGRMRYWFGGEESKWAQHDTKTPARTKREWEDRG